MEGEAVARTIASDERESAVAPPPPLSVSRTELLIDGSDAAFRRVIYGLFTCGARLHQCRDAFGAAIGLTGAQYTILIAGAHLQEERGIGIRALADYLQVATPHVTTEVGKLVKAGLLAKRPNPEDGRGVLVSVTAAGHAALEALSPFLREINDILFDGMTRDEFIALVRFIDKFANNTERAVARIDAVRGQGRKRPIRSRTQGLGDEA